MTDCLVLWLIAKQKVNLKCVEAMLEHFLSHVDVKIVGTVYPTVYDVQLLNILSTVCLMSAILQSSWWVILILVFNSVFRQPRLFVRQFVHCCFCFTLSVSCLMNKIIIIIITTTTIIIIDCLIDWLFYCSTMHPRPRWWQLHAKTGNLDIGPAKSIHIRLMISLMATADGAKIEWCMFWYFAHYHTNTWHIVV